MLPPGAPDWQRTRWQLDHPPQRKQLECRGHLLNSRDILRSTEVTMMSALIRTSPAAMASSALGAPLRPAVLDRDGPTFGPAEFA